LSQKLSNGAGGAAHAHHTVTTTTVARHHSAKKTAPKRTAPKHVRTRSVTVTTRPYVTPTTLVHTRPVVRRPVVKPPVHHKPVVHRPTAKPQHSRVGIATWYAWHPGQCASPFLPKGTRITVRDLATGKVVSCLVTDREADNPGRVVDLDAAVFQELAPLSVGVVRVKISW
jgi:rare lipoprotein A (peptidoglycan hydrolase)